MKLNELLKSFSLKNIFLILLIITNYFGALLSAEKKEQISQTLYDTDCVVRIAFRDFYDRKNNKYDKKSLFNKSGFSQNSKWDSIFILIQFIREQNPKAWWLNHLNKPSSIVIQFHNKEKAESFCKKLENEQYSFIVRDVKLEEFISRSKSKNQIYQIKKDTNSTNN